MNNVTKDTFVRVAYPQFVSRGLRIAAEDVSEAAPPGFIWESIERNRLVQRGGKANVNVIFDRVDRDANGGLNIGARQVGTEERGIVADGAEQLGKVRVIRVAGTAEVVVFDSVKKFGESSDASGTFPPEQQ